MNASHQPAAHLLRPVKETEMSWSFTFTAVSRQAALGYLDQLAQPHNQAGIDMVRPIVTGMVDVPTFGVFVNTYGHMNVSPGVGTSNAFVDVKQVQIVTEQPPAASILD
jgi:hypothetical protein